MSAAQAPSNMLGNSSSHSLAEPAALAFAPAPLPRRPRQLLVGAGFATAGVLMYFGALFGIYLSERSDFLKANPGQSWIPSSADLQLTAPSMIFWTLLLSLVTMQWCIFAAVRNDRRHLLLAVLVTGFFGIAVINQMAFIFVQMGLVIDDGSLAAPLIYTLCGSFIALVAAALISLVVAAFRSLGGQSIRLAADGFSATAMLWYAMSFIYFILWLAIFIAK